MTATFIDCLGTLVDEFIQFMGKNIKTFLANAIEYDVCQLKRWALVL